MCEPDKPEERRRKLVGTLSGGDEKIEENPVRVESLVRSETEADKRLKFLILTIEAVVQSLATYKTMRALWIAERRMDEWQLQIADTATASFRSSIELLQSALKLYEEVA